MIDPSEFGDVLVTVAHPYADIDVPLTEWVARGPGPRAFVQITAARRQSTGEPIPLDQIPLEYHNSRTSRQMQRDGLLPAPWGPPPEERSAVDLSRLPPELAEEIRRARGE